MAYHRFFNGKIVVFIPLLLLLIAAVACGEDATPTLEPTATATSVPATATPVPPTPTPLPEATPTPTAMAKAEPTPTPTAKSKPTPTPAPAFFTSTKADRLLVATAPPFNETNVPWLTGSVDMFDKRPWAEGLLHTDPLTGKYTVQLAKAWEMRPDGRQWTITLNEDVPIHKGFGTFTGEDVRHNWLRITSDESTATDANQWKGLLDSVDDIEVENDYVVRWNLARVEPDLDLFMSVREGNFLQTSKAQWEQGGNALIESDAAGTGPFEFVEREVTSHVLYQRVENHWRKTPEFKELMFQIVPENSTRLAMALTGETHLTTLPPDLQDQVVARGAMSRTIADVTGSAVVYNFGGQYYCQPDLLDPDNPFLDIRVREAMARAIDVEEIIDVIFQGRAQRAVSQKFHPSEQGWDPSFPALNEDLYGYDPDKSRTLLAEAGYPEGFSIIMHDNPWSFFPEMAQVNQSVANYWLEVGIDTELLTTGYATVRPLITEKNLHGRIQPYPPFNLGPPAQRTKIEHDCRGGGISLMYGHSFVDGQYDKLEQTVDRAERERLQSEIGRHFIENYAMIPIAHVPSVVLYDPNIVDNYAVNGAAAGTFISMEDTKATR